MTTPALDTLRALLPLLARDEDRAVTGIFGGDTLNAIEAALALIGDDDADDASLRHESEKAQLRAEIDRLQLHLTVSGSAFSALEAAAAEARRNDAIAMSWISEAKHAIGYEGDMPGFIEALRALKEPAGPEQVAHETRFSGDSCLRMANLELAGYRKRMREIATSMSVAEQDQINAEAAIRSIYGADADPWPTIVNGMITPAHTAPPCKAPPPPNDLEASIRDTIARFAATDDLAKDAADAVLEIVRPLAERSDRLECALREVIGAIEFTPLGVRGIKALQAARAALEGTK